MEKLKFHVEEYYTYAEKTVTGGKNFPYVGIQNFLFQMEKHIYAEKILTGGKKFPCVGVKNFLFYPWEAGFFRSCVYIFWVLSLKFWYIDIIEILGLPTAKISQRSRRTYFYPRVLDHSTETYTLALGTYEMLLKENLK